MDSRPDLAAAAEQMAAVAAGIGEDDLASPTPCAGSTVGDLLAHVLMLTLAFRLAAEKKPAPVEGPPPEPSIADLPPDWRRVLPERLDDLVAAWRDPAAWQGRTTAGGVDLAGGEAGVVALNELVLHAWDLASATGLPYRCAPEDARACLAFAMSVPDDPQARQGLFGPRVPVPEGAPDFDRLLGFSGRDPSWSPS
ncbi:TIGR03086 family metal-binding protein [Nocardiopsis potens]|uniref:TIGR03086 family metal-binding protein n=1 Tax=Nocardiopsis potens TaxID=1246458 RepID=UPI000347BEA0|nr:TIGR03086 family metal-binding protein [Nocardiopsis potens]